MNNNEERTVLDQNNNVVDVSNFTDLVILQFYIDENNGIKSNFQFNVEALQELVPDVQKFLSTVDKDKYDEFNQVVFGHIIDTVIEWREEQAKNESNI